ncbi:MAG: hypothetical protein ACI4QY_03440 [Oscillospiraceae bacterium]
MVWNSTQSSLYRAVSDYNNEIIRRERQSREEIPSDCLCDDNCEQSLHHSHEPEECKDCCGCPHRRISRQKNTPPGTLNLDSDFLLLAGLILILYRNGADMKLIAALAVVLLG